MRLFALILLSAWATSAHAADLSVRVGGAPSAGLLIFQVYDSPSAFGDFRDPVKELRVPVSADSIYRISDISPGDVAVLVYLDENENGVIDKNFIGIPKEPLGMSNNYRPKGPPAFQSARISVVENTQTAIEINLYRVLGERGRVGVGLGVIGRGSPYSNSDSSVLQAIPAITYNGERLQWLGPNIRYGLTGSGRWRLAASASYRVGAYEENDSPVLAGLGDRDGTLMAGLGLRVEMPGRVDLLLQYEHDVLDRIGGGAATARLSKGFQTGRLRLVPQFQLNRLSADLANYDFGVPPDRATLARPAYSPGSSTSFELGLGSFIELSENWSVVLNVSTEFLPDRIADSPIVSEDRLVKGFIALSYVF